MTMNYQTELVTEKKITINLFFFLLTVNVLISGARLVSSDEVSMYLTLERILTEGQISLSDPNAPNSIIYKGKVYSWYEIGNILTGIPLFLIAQLFIRLLPLPSTIEALLPRAAVSYTGGILGVFLSILFYKMCKKFGLATQESIIATLILTYTTPLLPYYKLFMREVLLSLCLLGGFYNLYKYNLNPTRNYLLISGIFIGYGILTKIVFTINVIPLLFYLYNKEDNIKTNFERIVTFSIPTIIIGLIGTGIYNYLKFQNPFNMGIGGGTTFPIPCYVGTYGLLFSAGKGILWFTPILIVLPFYIKYFYNKFPKETLTILSIFILNLLLYCKYIMWGGDGSWGPRYLIPTIPLLSLPIFYSLKEAKKHYRNIVKILGLIGLIIQIGGISIYAGSYLREINEVPYKKNFTDPEFLYKAHFIPNYSPIIGHWKMLTRNLLEHINGNYPNLTIKNEIKTDRIPVQNQDEEKLQHTLDFWFTYALYINIPFQMILIPLFTLLILSLYLWYSLLKKLKKIN